MLDVIVFLDPNGVPEVVLTSEPVRARLAGGASATFARRAIRNLWRLNLVTHDPTDPARSVRMHALAQRAGIENLTPETVAVSIRVAADALLSIWPEFEAGTALG